MLMKIC